MEKEFRNISKVGFMKHNGGLVFRKLSESEYEYKTTIQDFHMNAGGVTHGGYVMSMGTAAHQNIEGGASNNINEYKFYRRIKTG